MSTNENVQSYNVGKSDYSKHKIQPWDIWKEYNLNPWDADIVKRVLRSKEGEARTLDYEKIIHICKYRIAELSKEVLKESETVEPVKEVLKVAQTVAPVKEEKPGCKTATIPAEKADYKTVICPSEKDKPKLLYREGIKFNNVYEVYGVFQSDGTPYAYLGYWGNTHVYLELGASRKWSCYVGNWLPKRAFGLYSALQNDDHAVSMEIGKYGVGYKKHDYIISRGRLYRCMYTLPDGYVYMRFEDDGAFTKVITGYKLFNEAIQFTI